MKKHILACALALALTMGLCVGAQAATAPSVNAGMTFLYGNPVIIADGDTEGYTRIYVDENANGVIDAGETPVANANGDAEYDLSACFIYGCGTDDQNSDVKITMIGGTVFEVHGAFMSAVTGDFNFTMTGGTVKNSVIGCGSAKSWTGDINIHISGDAVVGNVYGGYQSSTATLNGAVNITVDGNARASVVYAAGQQSGTTLAGPATLTVAGSATVGSVCGNNGSYSSTLQDVTINLKENATITGNIIGCYGAASTARNVEINISGGVCEKPAIGVHNGTVTGTVTANISGGNLPGAYAGVMSTGTAGSSVVNMTGGTASSVYTLNGNGSAPSVSITMTGGQITSVLATRSSASSSPVTAINLSAQPEIEGSVRLWPGEAITAGFLRFANPIPVDVQSVNTAGTLIVRGSTSDIPSVDDYTLLNTDMSLVRGATADAQINLYLGELPPDVLPLNDAAASGGAGASHSVPHTGDAATPIRWALAAGLSGAALLLLSKKRKQHEA